MTIWPFFILTLLMGACVGSFLNVVVYRLPLELSLITPPSTCPKCGKRIAFYDNVPVLGWLWLRGRCRNCANPISPQYPILEAFCALMFGMLFLAYYHTGDNYDFFRLPGSQSAAVFVLHLFLLGGLIAASKIDANLFIIPLKIPWTVTIAALILVPASVYGFPTSRLVLPAATPWMFGAAAGGAIGLILAFIMLRRGVLPMSFLEPEGWGEERAEAQATDEGKGKKSKKKKKDKKNREKGRDEIPSSEKTKEATQRTNPRGSASEMYCIACGYDLKGLNADRCPECGKGFVAGDPATWSSTPQPPLNPRSKAIYLLVITAVAIALWLLGGLNANPNPEAPASSGDAAFLWARFAAFVLLWWGVLLVDFGAYGDPKELEGSGPTGWFIHPHPRFESLKEVLYLSFPIVGALIGIAIANIPGVTNAIFAAPLWTKALAGSVFGYLVGCLVVWAVRILGTLGFGKEAMGLGDVHLVGAIGAVIGAGDAVIAFLLAAFFGLGYALVEATLGRLLVKRGVQIPYGPHLCGAAIVLMLFRTPIKNFAVNQLGLPIFGW